jgi:hypothetical protein
MSIESVFFGLSPSSYDNGRRPSCAINASNVVVEVHKGESENTLNWRIGSVQGVHLSWLPRPAGYTSFGNGTNPAVAIDPSNVVIVVYDDNGLRYRIGTVAGNRLNFAAPATAFGDASSLQPSVAVNDAGIVLEVHTSGSDIYWRRGRLRGVTLNWHENPTLLAENGRRLFVAINNRGHAVVVFEATGSVAMGNDNRLLYSVGTFDRDDPKTGGAVTWTTPVDYDNGGARPSVALTDRNAVFETHQPSSIGMKSPLYQRVGVLANKTITWQNFLAYDTPTERYPFDIGRTPQVAANNKVAIQVHRTDSGTSLFANASLIFDRANWMGDHREQLKKKRLKDLALPAAHDAGAILPNPAQTQDITIRSQLFYGVRYFDLRPIYTGNSNDASPAADKFFTYHDVLISGSTDDGSIDGSTGLTNFRGPHIQFLVGRIRTFMQSHNELVILKISHFKNFNQKIFDALVGLFVGDDHLGPWLYKPSQLEAGKRLAEQTMDKYLPKDASGKVKGTVLIVADRDGENDDSVVDYVTAANRTKGIFRYRDWYASDPEKGDLTVFDLFTDTSEDFDKMATSELPDEHHPDLPGTPDKKVPLGQLPKFIWFDGKCQGRGSARSTVICDLFLLSWTLTPLTPEVGVGTAFAVSERANRNLVDYLARPANQGKNSQNFSMNLLYTDAVEFSRSVDVALVRNGLLTP